MGRSRVAEQSTGLTASLAFNSLRQSDAYMRLLGAKSLSEPMLEYC